MPVNNPPIPSILDDLVRKPVTIADNGLYYYATQPGMEEAILHGNNKTFVFYMGDDYDEWATIYDHGMGEWSIPVSVADGHTSNDGHFYASAVMDSSGYIYLAYGCHDSALYYKKSTNPYDISAWSVETTLDSYATYPHWVIDSADNLYIFYRSNNANPSYARYLKFRKSINGGSSFASAVTIVDTGDNAKWAYMGVVGLGSDDSLHLVWTRRDSGGVDSGSEFNNVYYMKSLDGGTTWKKSDGTTYTLPISPAAAEVIATSQYVFARHVQLDANNNPQVVYVKTDTDVYFTKTHLHYCYLSGGVWQDVTLPGADYGFSAHIAIRPGAMYLFTNQLISGRREVVMLRSVDSGATWQHFQLTSDSAIDNVNVVINNLTSSGDIKLIWSQGNDWLGTGTGELWYVDQIWIELVAKQVDASFTAADLLASIETVDGPGSGLDSDLVDGYHANSIPVFGDVTGTTGALVSILSRGLRETSGPTILAMGTVNDGEYLTRSGNNIIGGTPAGLGVGGQAIYMFRWVADGGTTYDYPDMVDSVFSATDNGLVVDPSIYSLSSDRSQLVFDSGISGTHVITSIYSIAQV